MKNGIYFLHARQGGNLSGFSSTFHKEILASTVSAQVRKVLLLRLVTICRRVSSPKTLDLVRLAER